MEDDLFGLERRKYVRFEVEFSLKYRITLENEKKPFTDWLHGMVENISLGGIRFNSTLSNKQIDALTEEIVVIVLELKLPGNETPVTCDAALRFFQRGAPANDDVPVDIGVEFVGLTDKNRSSISQFLQKIHLDS
ncbi:MAG TPA: PilZ domain-containing protein [Chitinivibrionales bacterium]|nr:PilZ domain-containing protein [Chitinivibrionales bacterium]